jgi:hypothetical protein
MGRVNLLSIPLVLLIVALIVTPYGAIWGTKALASGFRAFIRPGTFFPSFVFGVLVHEFLHGAGWVSFGRKSWKAIRFGIKWTALSPYAHCIEPLTARAYRLGAFLPGLVLGIAPAAIALVTGNAWLLYFGTLFTIAASGDFLILWLLRDVPHHVLVEDHPDRAGCFVYD